MDNVIYFVGRYTGNDSTDNSNRGFIACLQFDAIEDALESTDSKHNWGVDANAGTYKLTNNAIYGIAGRGQNAGMETEETT